MTAVPLATPVTTPVEPMVAMEVDPDDQVPPGTLLERVVVVPAHKDAVPVIAAGAALIVTTLVPKQPTNV